MCEWILKNYCHTNKRFVFFLLALARSHVLGSHSDITPWRLDCRGQTTSLGKKCLRISRIQQASKNELGNDVDCWLHRRAFDTTLSNAWDLSVSGKRRPTRHLTLVGGSLESLLRDEGSSPTRLLQSLTMIIMLLSWIHHFTIPTTILNESTLFFLLLFLLAICGVYKPFIDPPTVSVPSPREWYAKRKIVSLVISINTQSLGGDRGGGEVERTTQKEGISQHCRGGHLLFRN